MFCTKCGNKLRDDANFCTKCGSPIKTVVRASNNTDSPNNSATKTEAQNEQVVLQDTTKDEIKQSEKPTIRGASEQVATQHITKENKDNVNGQNQQIAIVREENVSEQVSLQKAPREDIIATQKIIREENTVRETSNRVSGNSSKKTNLILIIIIIILLAIIFMGSIFFIMPKITAMMLKNNNTQSPDILATESDEKTKNKSESIQLLPEGSVEGVIQRKIIKMNSSDYNEAFIDVYKDNYKVGPRNFEATWNKSIFYTLEGYENQQGYYNKNQCILVKKEMRNASNGNIIQYDIYNNPTTNRPNKIVSIEYLENGLEITEYYYDNNGQINFIFQYNADNYVSSYATPDKKGNRYFFKNDSMITWRSVTESGTTNYILGQAEADRMSGVHDKNTMVYYKNLSPEKKSEFDELEKKMLNAAYNTKDVALNKEGIASIQGYVYDANGIGISNSDIELYSTDFKNMIYSSKTDNTGKYTILVPNESYDYNIRVKKEGMHDEDIYSIKIDNNQIGSFQDTVYIFDKNDKSSDIELTLGDAFEYSLSGDGMKSISDAVVYFRRGINNRIGDIVSQASAVNGTLFTNLPPGVYTIEVNANGYETMFYTLVSNPLIGKNIYEFYAPPKLKNGEYAIVLTWGEYPYDLDSHVFTANSTKSDHIWFGDLYSDTGVSLDVDDVSSYGPETMTIENFSSTNYYKYCVVDFTSCTNGEFRSTDMSYSMANVNVYSSDGLLATFNVPTGKEGVVWEVFEIRNGNINPIQRYYGNVEDKTWWYNEK